MENTEIIDHNDNNLVPFEEIPRYKEPNPFNYNEETLALKNREILQIMKDYPNMSRTQISEVWDMVHNMDNDQWTEFKKKCNAPAIKRQPAGNLNTIEIVNTYDI